MNQGEKKYSWGHGRRFNHYSAHIRKQFSGRVQKLSVDAGFTCPNRDGTVGRKGCTYCNNDSFKPAYCVSSQAVEDQLKKGLEFFEKKYTEMRYFAYFQAYTNTHAPVDQLVELYERALRHPKIIGLVIATRPDCLSLPVLDYLQQLAKENYIMVELGLESTRNETLKKINRGHTFEQSKAAIGELHQRNIRCGAHMILGLPGESRLEILEQAKILSALPIENLKLHQLQIHKGTVMEQQYKTTPHDFNLIEKVDDYIELVIDYLEMLHPRIVMERFISQSPKEVLIAPKWGLKNFEFVDKLEKRLTERASWQGRLWENTQGG